MADNTETETLKLDLDNEDFVKKAKHAQGALNEILDTDNLKGMLQGFESLGLALGVVGATVFALKESFDLVLDAEKIQKVNDQFSMLAQNAGVSATTIREDLVKAAGGLADDVDILQAANKAMVMLGNNSEHLGQTMELARKVTNVFGGDLISNFENINQAIATGQTRLLRHMGIVVDATKAQKEYAKSIGVAVQDLTEEEKKQAVLNATLEAGNKQFKGVHENSESLTVSLQKLKVTFNELKDAIALALDKSIGPAMRSAFSSISEKAEYFANVLNSKVATGSKQAEANIKVLQTEIEKLNRQIEQQEEMKKYSFDSTREYTIASMQRQRAQLEESLKGAKDNFKKLHDEAIAAEEKSGAGGGGNDEKFNARREAQIKFDAESLKIQEQSLAMRAKNDADYEDLKIVRQEQYNNLYAIQQNEFDKLDQERAQQKIATDEEVAMRKRAIAEKTAEQIRKIVDESTNDEITASHNLAKANERTFSGIADGARAASIKASKDLGNFAKLGEQSFTAFNKNAVKAFESIGDGSKSAGDAMKGFMLNSLADIAEAQGQLLLASALLNPLNAVEGAALLVLAGVLRGAAGSAGSSSGIGGGGGGGGAQPEGLQSSASSLSNPAIQTTPATPQKSVTLQVMGSYFETAETKRTLMEMIRQETDATDFKYVQINQGVV